MPSFAYCGCGVYCSLWRHACLCLASALTTLNALTSLQALQQDVTIEERLSSIITARLTCRSLQSAGCKAQEINFLNLMYCVHLNDGACSTL
ncbi:hypothetical protein F5880DRAFT_958568 [Lentinula raphanica]|nr:hypothetical protein F5880DRAFT_958568 [Lentinula raphanica]